MKLWIDGKTQCQSWKIQGNNLMKYCGNVGVFSSHPDFDFDLPPGEATAGAMLPESGSS